jgi:hypothetical protein
MLENHWLKNWVDLCHTPPPPKKAICDANAQTSLKVSHHPKMAGNSLLGAHVFIYSFHLLGHQFSKIMFTLLRSTHI